MYHPRISPHRRTSSKELNKNNGRKKTTVSSTKMCAAGKPVGDLTPASRSLMQKQSAIVIIIPGLLRSLPHGG
jgi:hypothetical protein